MLSWFFIETFLKQAPFPSLADLFYLSYYPIFLLGIYFLPKRPLKKDERFNSALDMGEVSLHGGKIQIESESIEKVQGKEEAEMRKLINDALDERAEPEPTEFLIESSTLEKLRPKMMEAAKAIRRAVLDGRSILVRHHDVGCELIACKL